MIEQTDNVIIDNELIRFYENTETYRIDNSLYCGDQFDAQRLYLREFDGKIFVGTAFGESASSISQDYIFKCVSENFQNLPIQQIAEEQTRLTKHVALTPGQYIMIEDFLLFLLNMHTLTTAQSLIACRFALRFIESLVETISGPFQPMQPALPIPSGDTQLQSWLTQLKSGIGETLLPLALKQPKVSPILRKIYLSNIVTVSNCIRLNRKLQAPAKQMVIGMLQAFNIKRIDIYPYSLCSSNQLSIAGLPTKHTNASEAIRQYFKHTIFRKDLLLSKTVLEGLDCMITNASLLRWYASAQATQHNRNLEPTDFEQALPVIELNYGIQQPLCKLIENNSTLYNLNLQTTSHPQFPYLMLL